MVHGWSTDQLIVTHQLPLPCVQKCYSKRTRSVIFPGSLGKLVVTVVILLAFIEDYFLSPYCQTSLSITRTFVLEQPCKHIREISQHSWVQAMMLLRVHKYSRNILLWSFYLFLNPILKHRERPFNEH